jgi:hypothetical protein
MRGRIVSALFMVLLVSACANKHVRVKPNTPNDEVVTQAILKQAIAGKSPLKIMLRVPSAQTDATQQDANRSSAYNVIEKEFLKKGYTVRDRALLAELLRNNPRATYSEIRDKIDTDVILEITSIERHVQKEKDFVYVKNESAGMASVGSFVFKGWRFESRLVLVETGQVVGMYSFYILPGERHFYIDWGYDLCCAATEDGKRESFKHYSWSLDRAAKKFAQRIIEQL